MATSVTGEQYVEIDGKLHEIKRQLRQPNGYPYDPERLNHALQDIVEGRFAAIVGLSPFQKLLAACRLDRAGYDFSDEHYPLEPMALGQDEWEVYEHHFLKAVNGEAAFKEIEKMGYRLLGGPRRAMEFFIAHHAGVQVTNPLIITVRWLDKYGCWRVPVFNLRFSQNELQLDPFDGYFDPHYGWLVLRRKSAV